MLGQLPSVFLDVVAPVFAIVALGWALCSLATLTVLLALV